MELSHPYGWSYCLSFYFRKYTLNDSNCIGMAKTPACLLVVCMALETQSIWTFKRSRKPFLLNTNRICMEVSSSRCYPVLGVKSFTVLADSRNPKIEQQDSQIIIDIELMMLILLSLAVQKQLALHAYHKIKKTYLEIVAPSIYQQSVRMKRCIKSFLIHLFGKRKIP